MLVGEGGSLMKTEWEFLYGDIRSSSDFVLGVGVKREDIYITNVLKCRPANNRTPNFEETKACSYFCRRKLPIRPGYFSPGKGGCSVFSGPALSPLKRKGRWLEYNGIPVLPTYHPAYLLRQAGNDLLEAKKQWWADFYLVVNKAYGAREHQV